MNEERLITLLYNAIVLLEEQGYEFKQLKEELGITKKEYKKIMEEQWKGLKMNKRELIINIKELLDKLLGNAPEEDELDDYKVIEFYAEAKNLQEAIDNLGY